MCGLSLSLVMLFYCNIVFADSLWRQFEIATDQHDKHIAGAWAEEAGAWGEPMRCAFGVLDIDTKSWTKISNHENKSFDLSANPTLSIDDNVVIHAVCMSANFDYK